MRTTPKLWLLLLPSLTSHEPTSPPREWSRSLKPPQSIEKRQSGYNPITNFCGSGDTCSDACGKHFETCPSNEETLHCFDPSQQQTCCPNGSGNACDEGYYCAQTPAGATFCCPFGTDIQTCASLYDVFTLETVHSTTTVYTTSATAVAQTTTQVVTVTAVTDFTSTSGTVTQTTSVSGGTIRPSYYPNSTRIAPLPFTGEGEVLRLRRCGVVGLGIGLLACLL